VFGELRPDIARGLRIRCDNLPLFRGGQFCRPLARFGIKVTYIWPLTPRGNGLAERFVRTLRDNRLAVRFFATSSELLVEMAAFRTIYNDSYILQRWKYRTPAEVRALFFPREM
jgi:putative transposase